MKFPADFAWGVATAAYQIEGATAEGGRKPSVWDMMCRKPGAIWNGQTGDVTCDHYHRYKEDVAIMKKMGLKAYRMSISWSRVIPDGVGAVNPKGLDFYDKLVDSLLAAGVEPFVTLFHWDYPYELYCRGGWLNRESADWFAQYAQVMAKRLGDRVSHWITMNEPQCFILLGHQTGIHAPGDKLNQAEILRAAHHALLAHGRGVQALRANSPQPCKIGWAPVGVVSMPASDRPADIRAARQATFAIKPPSLWNNTWWNDPVLKGEYPADGLEAFAKDMPAIRPGDMETMRQPLDFFGVNIYNGQFVKASKNGQAEAVPHPVGGPMSHFLWPVTPECLYWGPKFFQERYKLPVYITENGMSNVDWVSLDGKVHDPQRIDYLNRYLLQLGRAINDKIDIRGYFVWTLCDNFEWGEGHKQRFGMVHVDYATQKRTLKDSALWYKKVIATAGASLG